MLIQRGYRFKLKTTPDLEAVFRAMVGHARFVWNKALRLNLDRLDQGLPIVWYNDLCGLLRLWKQSEEYGFLAEANAQTLQQKLRDLDRAFTDAFDPAQPMKRLPRLKKRGEGDSLRFPQDVKVENRRIFLPKIGWVGFFRSRKISGTIKNATITCEADGWYVSIQAEAEIPRPKLQAGTAIGVDRGIVVFAATSEGDLVEPLNAGANLQRQLARLQRKLARQRKGSKNRAKTKAKIARLNQRIRRQREDFLHKVSTRWSKSHALIVLEDLRIRNMTQLSEGHCRESGVARGPEERAQSGHPGPGLGRVRSRAQIQAGRTRRLPPLCPAAAFQPGVLGVRSRRAGEPADARHLPLRGLRPRGARGRQFGQGRAQTRALDPGTPTGGLNSPHRRAGGGCLWRDRAMASRGSRNQWETAREYQLGDSPEIPRPLPWGGRQNGSQFTIPNQ